MVKTTILLVRSAHVGYDGVATAVVTKGRLFRWSGGVGWWLDDMSAKRNELMRIAAVS